MKIDGVFCATGGRPFDREGNVVVLIHGAGENRTAWKYQTRFLAHRGFSPLAIDLPGHGRTPGPLRPSIEEQASWLVGWLKESVSVPVSLVGHSMGSLVALLAAAAGSDVVKSVVFIAAAAAMPVHEDLLQSSADGDDQCLRLLRAWMHRDSIGGHVEPGMWLHGQSWTTTAANGYGPLNSDLNACNDFVTGDALEKVGVPTLVISGDADRMTPARRGRELARSLSGSRFELVDEAGHRVMIEQSRAVNELLVDFLGGPDE
jgi:pimeloyl-ACP methyl ester carboxylesterase